MKLQASDADQIIQHLKNGNPPPIRLMPHLHVGRERWLDGMGWYLDKAADSQLSAVRIVAGDYGDGKTHFLRMTSYLALQRNFVACEVTLTSDVRLDHF